MCVTGKTSIPRYSGRRSTFADILFKPMGKPSSASQTAFVFPELGGIGLRTTIVSPTCRTTPSKPLFSTKSSPAETPSCIRSNSAQCLARSYVADSIAKGLSRLSSGVPGRPSGPFRTERGSITVNLSVVGGFLIPLPLRQYSHPGAGLPKPLRVRDGREVHAPYFDPSSGFEDPGVSAGMTGGTAQAVQPCGSHPTVDCRHLPIGSNSPISPNFRCGSLPPSVSRSDAHEMPVVLENAVRGNFGVSLRDNTDPTTPAHWCSMPEGR